MEQRKSAGRCRSADWSHRAEGLQVQEAERNTAIKSNKGYSKGGIREANTARAERESERRVAVNELNSPRAKERCLLTHRPPRPLPVAASDWLLPALLAALPCRKFSRGSRRAFIHTCSGLVSLRLRTMPESGDENDSRTASVGVPRNPANASNSSSRRSSHERATKRRKRMGDRDVRDFVPQGATFSMNPLDVGPDSVSSSDGVSGSDVGSHGANAALDAGSDDNKDGGTRIPSGNEEKPQRFDAIKVRSSHSLSRSSSVDVTTSEGDDSGGTDDDDDDDDDDTSSGTGSTNLSDDSGDSDSIDSEEADDSIVLNIGSRNPGSRNGEKPAQGSEYDPESRRVIEEGFLNSKALHTHDGVAEEHPFAQSKEEALRRFSRKYPTAPSTLVDLDHHDFEVQAKFLHFDRDINDVNLDLPIGCTECLREGHLAEVCPSKEVRPITLP